MPEKDIWLERTGVRNSQAREIREIVRRVVMADLKSAFRSTRTARLVIAKK